MADPLLDAFVSLGVDATVAGALLGLSLIVTLVLIFRMLLGEMDGFGFIIPALAGLAFSFALGWFPVWVGIIFVLGIIAFIVFSMKSGGGGE